MKKIFIIMLGLSAMKAYSQVAIGKASVTNNSVVSLEFGNSGTAPDRTDATKQKGILLPWVTSAAAMNASSVPGTIIYDTNDKKVKVAIAATPNSTTISSWKDLSIDATGVVDTSAQSSLTELANAKASIGTPTSVPGILVLEDTNKAMVLPLVDKYSTVVAPEPGMMVYDLSNSMLCVYNGTVWTFWKP